MSQKGTPAAASEPPRPTIPHFYSEGHLAHWYLERLKEIDPSDAGKDDNVPA